jgi:hypothetical protein
MTKRSGLSYYWVCNCSLRDSDGDEQCHYAAGFPFDRNWDPFYSQRNRPDWAVELL